MSDPKPLGPAELNSGDLAGRVTALESVVHSWVEVCRQLREKTVDPILYTEVVSLNNEVRHVTDDLIPELSRRLGALAERLTLFAGDLDRLDAVVSLLCRAHNQARLRRIKRHRYPKPKGKLTR